jgi:FHS family L-fucose permease-like MFS transporter
MAQQAGLPLTGQHKGNYILSITIIGIFFFIFGFVTWLNSVLIPFLKITCEKNNFESYFVTFAFYISYFVMAIPSSFVLLKTGFKNGMSLGLVLMAIGALIFIPAAYSRMYGLFLTGLFVQGTGLAVLQTASNPYVTILGPLESAAKRISIMGICNKIAGVISPLILGAIVLKGMDRYDKTLLDAMDELQKITMLNELAGRIILPYIIMAIVLVIPTRRMRRHRQQTQERQASSSFRSSFWGWLPFLFMSAWRWLPLIPSSTMEKPRGSHLSCQHILPLTRWWRWCWVTSSASSPSRNT